MNSNQIHTSASLSALKRNELVSLSLAAGITVKPYSLKTTVLIEHVLALQAAANTPVESSTAVAIEENPETELRRIWTEKGISQEKQDELIRDVTAKAQPGAKVGPFEIPSNVVAFDPEQTQTEIPVEKASVKENSDGIFKINRKVFLLQLHAAGKVIDSSAKMPILASVLLSFGSNRLRIEANNLDASVSTTVPAETTGEYSVAVPYKVLAKFVSKCSSEFLMAEHKNNRLFLSDLENRTQISTLPGTEFPAMLTSPTEKPALELKSSRLIDVITETIKSASTDATRYILFGIFLDLNRDEPLAVSTDGRRLTKVVIGADSVSDFDRKTSEGRYIIPSKGALAIQQSLPAETIAKVSANDRRLTVRAELNGLEYVLTTKLIEGNFPNYQQVIPKDEVYTENAYVINRVGLIATLGRLMVLITEKSNNVKLTFTNGNLRMNVSSPDRGEGVEEIKADGNSPVIIVALNPDFLLETLNSWKDETVTLSPRDSESPIVVKGEGKLTVIMPVRLG